MAREPLSEDEIRVALEGTQWLREGDEIVAQVRLGGFREAMAFVNSVADQAEALDHHPDITISWNKVTLRLTTHSAGGLTALDFELARAIDALRERGS